MNSDGRRLGNATHANGRRFNARQVAKSAPRPLRDSCSSVSIRGFDFMNSRPHIEFRNVSAFYGAKQVLKDISFSVPRNSVIGIIGPANSGKTTLLKTINRTLD